MENISFSHWNVKSLKCEVFFWYLEAVKNMAIKNWIQWQMCNSDHSGSILIWWCKAGSDARNLVSIESTICKIDSLTILKENVVASVRKLDFVVKWKFLNHGNSKHLIKILEKWSLYHTPNFLYYPRETQQLTPLNIYGESREKIVGEWLGILPYIIKVLVE